MSEKNALIRLIEENLNKITIYSDTLAFDENQKEHLKALVEAGKYAQKLLSMEEMEEIVKLSREEAIEAAKELRKQGKIIGAVKVLKENTSMGLREAKAFMDNNFQ